MATSPLMSPSVLIQNTKRVSSWLEQLPLTPPANEEHRPLKRKRASSEPIAVHQRAVMSAHCDISPIKRQQVITDDDLLPGQSASAFGNSGTSNKLSLRSSYAGTSTRGNNLPRWAIATLTHASPPITTKVVNRGIPARVVAMITRLRDGLHRGWIPGWLERELASELYYEPTDFSKTATPDLSDPNLDDTVRARLVYTLRKVRKVFENALRCQEMGRDENAWCDEVVRPMVKLALRLYAGGKLCVQNNIDDEFLSRAIDTSGKQRILDRKADYTLSYSHEASPFESLYAHLPQNGINCISHTTDPFTKTTAVFSSLEVKPENSDKTKALRQLSVQTAASLRKKVKLGRDVGLLNTTCLVEPGFIVVGDEMFFYIAFLEPQKGEAVRILKFGNAVMDSVSGVFKQLKMWQNVIEYALDQGPDGFWGGFLKQVIERLMGGDGEIPGW